MVVFVLTKLNFNSFLTIVFNKIHPELWSPTLHTQRGATLILYLYTLSNDRKYYKTTILISHTLPMYKNAGSTNLQTRHYQRI